MPVFLDTSRRRKFYFRAFAIAVAFITIFILIFLSTSIIFQRPQHAAITYAEAKEAYHFYYSAASKRKVALTFDDGPRPRISEDLMETLEKNEVPATFFYIGRNALAHPNIVEEAASRGFEIGSHSFTHYPKVHESENRLVWELNSTDYLISRITGSSPRYYRPPFLLGIGVDPTLNPYIPPQKDVIWIMQNGYFPVGSDIDPRDWLAESKEDVIEGMKNALQNSPNGHIVLLHEDKHTLEALDEVIALIRTQGYEIVPLEELLTPPREVALTHALALGDTDTATNGEVSSLQWFLYKNGNLDPYLVTGVFGPATQRALINFQIQKEIVTGSTDPSHIGSADEMTRGAIRENSHTVLASASAAAPAHIDTVHVEQAIGSFLRQAYVNIFPVLRDGLAAMVVLTLALVVVRCAVIFGLLIIEFFQRKRAVYADLPAEDERGVSVLIPAYNEQENIRSTIESILRSAHTHKEVIVIDDGSTDNTGEIVKSVVREYPNYAIRLIQVENGGKASALNHGLEVAQFDVCAVIDADAVLHPDALSYFVRHFGDPEVGAVAGKVDTTNSPRTLDLFQKLEYAIGQNIDKRALSVLGAVGVVPGPAGAWSRPLVMSAGGFSKDTLVEDQDMTLTLLRMGKKVAYEERALAYTETPHTVKNFLKQRFRWVYGTMQCFWKHKGVLRERPGSSMSVIVMPNIFIFNILLPLTYPFADSALIFGLLFGEWQSLVLPFAIFTVLDLAYASFGVMREPDRLKLLGLIPFQRIVYRQLLYYTVARGVIRAVEGTGSGWSKFKKVGETQRFYFSSDMSLQPAVNYLPTQLPSVIPEIDPTYGMTETSYTLQSHEETMLSAVPQQFTISGSEQVSSSSGVLASVDLDPNSYQRSITE